MIDAGVTWVLGTDAGISPAKPHHVLPLAVSTLVDVGAATIREALIACTSRAAEAIGASQSAGRLSTGHPADILLVDGRVDHDVTALHKPLVVLRHGSTVITSDHARRLRDTQS